MNSCSPVKNKKNLINIDTQFMIGKDLLVCPNLSPTDTMVTCSFPAGIWCSLISGTERTRTEHVRQRFLFALFTDLCLDMSKTDQVQLSIRESGLDYFQKSETIIFSTRPEMTVEQVLSLLFLEHPSQLKTSESTIRLPR